MLHPTSKLERCYWNLTGGQSLWSSHLPACAATSTALMLASPLILSMNSFDPKAPTHDTTPTAPPSSALYAALSKISAAKVRHGQTKAQRGPEQGSSLATRDSAFPARVENK